MENKSKDIAVFTLARGSQINDYLQNSESYQFVYKVLKNMMSKYGMDVPKVGIGGDIEDGGHGYRRIHHTGGRGKTQASRLIRDGGAKQWASRGAVGGWGGDGHKRHDEAQNGAGDILEHPLYHREKSGGGGFSPLALVCSRVGLKRKPKTPSVAGPRFQDK